MGMMSMSRVKYTLIQISKILKQIVNQIFCFVFILLTLSLFECQYSAQEYYFKRNLFELGSNFVFF